jgi:hypothetical protein
MGNASRNEESENAVIRQLTGNDSFEQQSAEEAEGHDQNHLLNLGWRNKSGKRQHFMLNGIMALQQRNARSDLSSKSLNDGLEVISLENQTHNSGNRLNTSLEGSWLIKGNEKWKMLKISGIARHSGSLQRSDWNNLSKITGELYPVENSGLYRENSRLTRYEGTLTTMRNLGGGFFLEPSTGAGFTGEWLKREQGVSTDPFTRVDSLSPETRLQYLWINPTLQLKKYGKKLTFSAGVGYLAGRQKQTLNDSIHSILQVSSVLPRANLDYEIRAGRRLSFEYFSSLTLPTVTQLLPVISSSNPLAVLNGNPDLRPQKRHFLAITWFLYDQFSFTSLFAGLDGSVFRDKISSSVKIDEQLRQTTTLVNVPTSHTGSAFVDFSTPVRPLGLNVGIGFRESYNRGLSYVNGNSNYLTRSGHRFKLKFDNRKKDVWDVEIGGELELSRSSYSIMKALNTRYYNTSLFCEVRCTPSVHWHFRFTSDLTRYNASDLGKSLDVPLLSAEIDFFFKEDKTSSLVLEGSDLLNRDTGYNRYAENNTFREVHSSVIGRIVMLSYRYRFKP